VSVELRPLGVSCNIQCLYCYQNPQRDAGNLGDSYDLGLMKARTEQEGGPFTLFGGEALLVPARDLEDLWAWGLERYGSNGIQTNGVLIDEEHIRLFKKYRVRVGISVDGPGALNDARWAGTLERTREATERTHAAIERLCREGVGCSLIVTLHRANATADKLPILHEWFRHMDSSGVSSARLHVLEVDDHRVREKYALDTEENLRAFLSFGRVPRAGSGMDEARAQRDADGDPGARRLLLPRHSGRDRARQAVRLSLRPRKTRGRPRTLRRLGGGR
jgi:uncharacterized protein